MTVETRPLDMAALLANASWLRRLATHLVRGEDSAEDAVQETWAAALRSAPARPEAVRPWLRRVLQNAIRRHGRTEARRRRRETAVAPLEAQATAQAETLETLELQRRITDLVGALDEPYRTTVVMRYFEEKSSGEIGRLLGVPEGTVRWRLKEALDRLRRALDERNAGDRQAWMIALMPLLRPGPAAPALAPPLLAQGSSLKLGIGAALTATVAVLGLALGRACPADDGASGVGVVAAPSGQAPNVPPPAPARQLAARVAGAACIDRLQARARELAEAEQELRRVSRADRVFARSTPDEAARARFAPILDTLLDAVADPPAHSLECRRHACRLVLTEPEGSPSKDRWMYALQRDRAFAPLTGGLSFTGEGGKRRDPLSGAWLDESVVYWKLPDLGGEDAEEVPPSAADCPERLSKVESQLASLRSEAERHRPLLERFGSGAPDPDADKEVGAMVDRALLQAGKSGIEASTTCRGGVCKIELTAKDQKEDLQDALLKVIGSHALRVRLGGDSVGGWAHAYLPLRERSSGESMAALLELHRRFKASGTVERCRARHGGGGPLGGTIWIGEPESPARPESERLANGLSFSFGPQLPARPDGPCILEAFREAARRLLVPAHQADATLPFWLVRPAGP